MAWVGHHTVIISFNCSRHPVRVLPSWNLLFYLGWLCSLCLSCCHQATYVFINIDLLRDFNKCVVKYLDSHISWWFLYFWQMATGSTDIRILEQRRCLLLASIGSTAESMSNNPTLKKLLNGGLLVTFKSWLDDILSVKVGGVDLLLHLLSNIAPLP